MSVPVPPPDPFHTLSPERYQRVRELFDLARALPEHERAARLESACAGDPALLASVQELVAAADSAPSRFSPDHGGIAARALAPDHPIHHPERLGPYIIQRLIGRGGMGLVYLATQQNPHREVAIKTFQIGPGPESLRARFAREVRVLGRLEHPGIARIYDAGEAATPMGPVSYFAMEYIAGPRLTEYARKHSLDPRACVELLADVADAVQHAHTKGVIHRDLKPANILVREDPSSPPHPKILDFGVARLLEPDAQHTALTEQGLLVGTIGSMSPEQLQGDPDSVDARTDIYALGVILYELISGRPPHDLAGKPIAEAARIIRDEEPPPLRAVAPACDRDLETIVSRALEKDRDRRYVAAAAFADDLRRYLRHEPISARSATAAYQIARFARRNRGLVVASAAAALALLAGLVVSVVLYVREGRALRKAADEASLSTAVRSYMIEGLLMAASPDRMGYDVKMMDVLTHAADGLHERFADHPAVEAQVRAELGRVFVQLGKFKDGAQQYELAIPLVQRDADADDPRVIDLSLQLAEAVRLMQDSARSLTIAMPALEQARRRFPPGHPTLLLAFAQAGAALSVLNRPEEAAALLREGLDQARYSNPPDEQNTDLLLNWLFSCEMAQEHFGPALELARQVEQRTVRRFGPNDANSISARSNLVNLLTRNNHIQEAAAIAVELPAAAEKTFPPGHPARGFCNASAADALRQARRFEEAERCALAGYQGLVAAFDDLNWSTEQSIRVIRKVYADWPGHTAQLRHWVLESARVRLMVAGLGELPNTQRTITNLAAECTNAGTDLSPGDLAELLWNDRDALAPVGHPRRAALLANLALVFAESGRRDHLPQALDLAAAALPDAHDKVVAQDLLSAAQAK